MKLHSHLMHGNGIFNVDNYYLENNIRLYSLTSDHNARQFRTNIYK